MNIYGGNKSLNNNERNAIRNIQEIGATYLGNTEAVVYQYFSIAMISVVVALGLSYFIGTATSWFPYFGIAFLVLLLSQIAVHLAIRTSFTQMTQDMVKGEDL
jgi:hypothetical protein